MAWIELHQSLATHKKTRRLARALGLGVPDGIPQAIGHLCLFWLWCIDGTEEGNLSDLDAQDIADAAGWKGEAEVFQNAMISAGFIDRSDNGLCIHDWYSYIGKLLEHRKGTREKERVRKQKYRQRQKSQEEEKPPASYNTDESAIDSIDEEWLRVVTAYQENIGLLPTGTASEILQSFTDDMGAEVVVMAIKVTNTAQPNNPWKYLKAILDKWAENNIDTPEKAAAYTKDLERKLKQRKGAFAGAAAEPPAITGDFY